MNLAVLTLTNKTLGGMCNRWRLMLSAFLGALFYVLPLLIPGSPRIKGGICFIISTFLMIKITFRPRTLKAYAKALQWMLCDTFLLGGAIACILRLIPALRMQSTTMVVIVAIGVCISCWVLDLRAKRQSVENHCKVTLVCEGERISVEALIDTGNGLMEPISQKPVSVIQKGILEKLWKGNTPTLYRAIPYHSVGKKNGILMGYLIPEVIVEQEGMSRTCKNICVGVRLDDTPESQEAMILNPQILKTE
jgi:sigma-E processing peptidase SpoIIGA